MGGLFGPALSVWRVAAQQQIVSHLAKGEQNPFGYPYILSKNRN